MVNDVARMKFDYDPASMSRSDGGDDESYNHDQWQGFQKYQTFQVRVRDPLKEIAKKLYDFSEFL